MNTFSKNQGGLDRDEWAKVRVDIVLQKPLDIDTHERMNSNQKWFCSQIKKVFISLDPDTSDDQE